MCRELVIAKRIAEDKQDERMVLAWTIAALERQKKLPDLQTLLTKREPKRQSHKQMRTMLHQIAERYGLTIRQKADRG